MAVLQTDHMPILKVNKTRIANNISKLATITTLSCNLAMASSSFAESFPNTAANFSMNQSAGTLVLAIANANSQSSDSNTSNSLGLDSFKLTPIMKSKTTSTTQSQEKPQLQGQLSYPNNENAVITTNTHDNATHSHITNNNNKNSNVISQNDPTKEPLYYQQWYINLLNTNKAWQILKTHSHNKQGIAKQTGNSTKPAVTIAVLDTGYVNSPELVGRVTNGYDFVSDPQRAGDGNGRDSDASGVGQYAYHAEVIANIIAAGHNGLGMAGINPQAHILHVRVADIHGTIRRKDLIDGLRWAAGLPVAGVPRNTQPAKILNVSLFVDFIPLTGCDKDLQLAINEITRHGTLVVAGSGNDGAEAGLYSPAGCQNVLTVTSIDSQQRRLAYANWGNSVDIAAFGGDHKSGKTIVSHSILAANSIKKSEGTSLATPQAVGAASLLLTLNPKLKPQQLSQILTQTARKFTMPCDSNKFKSCGIGLLNIGAAIKVVLDDLNSKKSP